MIYSPKADGIDQDGRPAARHVLSRSGWRHLKCRLTPRFRTIQICPKDLPIRSVAGWACGIMPCCLSISFGPQREHPPWASRL